MDKERTVMLVLNDQDGLAHRTSLLELHTALPVDQVIPAIKAACQDYLNTPEGRKQWEDNCQCFNYGDFDMYVSNEFCKPHGFTKVDEETFEVVDDDFNTTLAEPEYKEGTGFMLDAPYSTVEVRGEDIDDIMESAMGGCTHWCERVDPVDGYLGKYASEQISRDGKLAFILNLRKPVILDKEKFQKGLNMWLDKASTDTLIRVLEGGLFNPDQIDANDADSIIQYALFGKLIYS